MPLLPNLACLQKRKTAPLPTIVALLRRYLLDRLRRPTLRKVTALNLASDDGMRRCTIRRFVLAVSLKLGWDRWKLLNIFPSIDPEVDAGYSIMYS
jgi:hypothetical protein